MTLGKTKAKRIMIDMIINLAGTGISLAILQLVIYPILAKALGSEDYGQMQSIISVLYLLSGTLGGSLHTTRLVREYEYNENRIKADFNLLSLGCIAATVVGIPVMMLLYARGMSFIDIALITVIGIFNFTSNYYAVGFRLKIDYKAIFLSKIIGSLGYGIGYGVFCLTGKWQFVYIVSFLLETLYYYFKTDLFREPYQKSSLFKKTVQAFANLGIAGLLSKTLTYFDKLLLYPLLGGTAVSIYVTANVFGKLILMTIEPITNVVLSYLSRQKRVSKNIWKIAVLIGAAGCALMYFVCLLVSGPVLNIFYPQWAEESLRLVPLTTLSLAISAFLSIVYPFTLKTIDTSRQIILNIIGIAAYIVSVLLLYKPMGVRGCCIALIISYTIKLLFIFLFCFRRMKKEEKAEEREVSSEEENRI